jgi:nucleotide-binding universal stress UspA family protein
MFEHLLVPLDGSHLAEAALPAATYLAQALSAKVTLIHIIEQDPPPVVHGEPHLRDPEEAHAYLAEVARQAFPAHLSVEQHVHTTQVSDVARTIVNHIDELGLDLIIMCTHGRSGWHDWLFGSIAQQVLALDMTPVLLVHPTSVSTFPSFVCQQLLVPLDGHPDHEQGLRVANHLAHSLRAKLHLVMVIPTLQTLSGQRAATGRLLPTATTALLDITEQEAAKYLRHHLTRLQAGGLPVTAEVDRGDPAANIARAVEQVKADLVVLGTHGKKGVDAFWSGSLTPKLLSRFSVPLLLVPVRLPV